MPQRLHLPLIQKNEVAKDTLELKFWLNRHKFNFIAGQYVGLWLDKLVEPDPYGNVRSLSLVNSPGDTHLVLVLRIRDSGYKKTLSQTPLNSLLEIDGPYGQFTLHQDTKRPAVFIAGGVGIAPVISIINDALSKKLPYKITVFYSNKSPATSAYLNEVNKWPQKSHGIQVINTMTKATKKDWDGLRGRIDKNLITKYTKHIKKPIYYIVGLPDMVVDMQNMLYKMGVKENDVKTENFTGY